MKSAMSPHQTALLVTHGGIIASLLLHWFPEQQNYGQWQPGCGCLLQIEFDRETPADLNVTILRRIDPQ